MAESVIHRFDASTSDRGAELRSLGVLMAAGGAVIPFVPDVGTICPLRRLTGVPCPFCGMTTGTLELAHGDIVASVAANPFAVVLVTAIIVAFIPAIYRSGWFRASWRRIKPMAPVIPLLLLPLLWLWELNRFDFI